MRLSLSDENAFLSKNKMNKTDFLFIAFAALDISKRMSVLFRIYCQIAIAQYRSLVFS